MKIKSKAVILIVDDKPSNILVLENLLAEDNRTLLAASNGKDALQIALNKNVDLIVLDVQMPDMDGFEVAQILKSNRRTKDIPIIFATAENKEHRFIMQGYDEGAIDYLFKPLDPDIVKAKVNVLLHIQQQRKELIEKNNSLRKCSLLIENSADIIGIIDAKSCRIEEINSAFTQILGYSREESIGTDLTFYLSNEDRTMVQELNKKSKDQFSFQTRVYCKDRRIKWLHWNLVVRFGKWFVNARDITEIKEVERIRNYLATVVKQSNDAIYIHDHEGKIISWNEGAEKIYGYAESEALQMKIWNIIPEYMQSESGQIVNQIIYGKKIQDLETKRITKHGKLIDVLFSATVITEGADQEVSIAITERDITHQKIAEEKLKENEQFLNSILNTMSESVVVTDPHGKPVLMNAAAESILGKNNKPASLEEWPGTYGLFNPDAKSFFPSTRLPIKDSLRGEDPIRPEIFIENTHVPEGIYVVASSNPLKDSYNSITGCVCVFHDITERKKAEKALKESEMQLQAANSELESFSYSVSHDLRAPLRGINGYSQMLQEDYGSLLDEEGNRLLERIRYNARQMSGLIDDLLDFSRLGRKALEKSEVDIHALVHEVINDLKLSGSEGPHIKLHALYPAYADAALIRQVLINLISNAIKYSAKKNNPEIEIGSTITDNGVAYYVKDNGAGFDMKYADKLFGVFQRLHSPSEFEGTGIGLAIVHRIVVKHGGKVWAESEPGKGATFHFTLPDCK